MPGLKGLGRGSDDHKGGVMITRRSRREYTAEELAARRDAGEGRTDHQLDAETARQRRAADPEAPLPYDGWQDTIRTDLPKPG